MLASPGTTSRESVPPISSQASASGDAAVPRGIPPPRLAFGSRARAFLPKLAHPRPGERHSALPNGPFEKSAASDLLEARVGVLYASRHGGRKICPLGLQCHELGGIRLFRRRTLVPPVLSSPCIGRAATKSGDVPHGVYERRGSRCILASRSGHPSSTARCCVRCRYRPR